MQNGGPPLVNAKPSQALGNIGTQFSFPFAYPCHLPAVQSVQALCLLWLGSRGLNSLPLRQHLCSLPRTQLGNTFSSRSHSLPQPHWLTPRISVCLPLCHGGSGGRKILPQSSCQGATHGNRRLLRQLELLLHSASSHSYAA